MADRDLPSSRGALLCAILAVALALAWQSLIVYRFDHGNWSALFQTSRDFPPPAELAFEHLPLTDKSGYDGQFYHYVAHDPWIRKYDASHFDWRAYRYGKMLVPVLAYGVAFGRTPFIDAAYVSVILAFVGLGAFALSRFAISHGLPALTGLAFLFLPATILGLETLTVDVALAALTVCFAVLVRSGSRAPLFAVLAAAPLVRETGAVLLVACAIVAALRRSWRDLLLASAAALPCFAWMAFIRWKAGPNPYRWRMVPFAGTADAVRAAFGGLSKGIALVGFDLWLIAGVLIGAGIALWRLPRGGVLNIACALFAGIVLVHQGADLWVNYHALARVFSPLAGLLALQAIMERDPVLALPLALMLPRCLLGPAARLMFAFS